MMCLKAAKNLQKCVHVEWEDGLMAKFSYVWLRDNTYKRPCLIHLDLNTRPEGIKCSKEALLVHWPPFEASKYTSAFLRKNALLSKNSDGNKPSSSGLSHPLLFNGDETPERGTILDDVHQNTGEMHHKIVDASLFPIDESLVLGTCFWEEEAQEPGTIWPHLPSAPSLVSVETMNGPSELSIVDSGKALAQLRACFPEEFHFLTGTVLEYSEGLYRSSHRICSVDEQGNILPGVFNNAARSSTITVESLDRLYEALQKFGRLCAKNTHFFRLLPGQRLLFNNRLGMLGVPAQRERLLVLKCIS